MSSLTWLRTGNLLVCKGRSARSAARAALVLGEDKPTRDNTGVIPGIPRTAFTGQITASTPGQVIENLDLTGNIRVRAPGVIIRNVNIIGWVGTPTSDSAFIDCNSPLITSPALIEDVTINPTVGHYYLYGVNGWNFTASRVNIRNCVDGFQPYNTTNPGGDLNVHILGCLGEEFYFSAVPSAVHSDLLTHNDFVQIQDGRGVHVEGCIADMHYGPRSTGTPPSNGIGTDGRPRAAGSCTAFMYTPNFRTRYVGPCKVTKNWVYGGSYPVNAGATAGFDIGEFSYNQFDHNQGSQNNGGDDTRVILLAKDYTATDGPQAVPTVVDLGGGPTSGTAGNTNRYEDNQVLVPVRRA